MNGFAKAVALNLARLMAYKDEYEVARLYTNGDFKRQLNQELEGDFRISAHMAPPFLSRRNTSGEPAKRTFGPWIMPVLTILARMKRLRGTRLDPFGRTEERRAERKLIQEYEDTLHLLVTKLNHDNHALAVEIASLPDMIRGFGHVKLGSVTIAERRRAMLMKKLTSDQPALVAAE